MYGLACDKPPYRVDDSERSVWGRHDVALISLVTPSGLRGIILKKGSFGHWGLMRKADFNVPGFPSFPYMFRAHHRDGLRACDTEADQRALVEASGLNLLGMPIRLPR